MIIKFFDYAGSDCDYTLYHESKDPEVSYVTYVYIIVLW